MWLKITSFILFSILYNNSFAQIDTTETDTTKWVYKNLETKKFYGVGLLSGDGTNYKLNDKIIDKSVYDKYYSTWKNMTSCKPCILETYDANDILKWKGIQYTDCAVGFWIEYYTNGIVKVLGHYRENETGDWDSAFYKGYCISPDGTWTYYNEHGQKRYSEYWKNGEFIKQVPEQQTQEIWAVEQILNGQRIDNQFISPEQIKNLAFTPRFKNKNTAGTNITIKFEVGVSGINPKIDVKEFTIDNFKNIDVREMMDYVGMTNNGNGYFVIGIYNNGQNIFNRNLNVKID